MTSSPNNNDILYYYGVKQIFIVNKHVPILKEGEIISKFIKDTGLFDAVIYPLCDIYLERVIKSMNYDSKYI